MISHNLNLNKEIGVIGLGYVGLPLALAFSKFRKVVGFYIDLSRITALKGYVDTTNECSTDDLKTAKNLIVTEDTELLKGCDISVVTVPTPVDTDNKPDMGPLISACKLISTVMKPGNIIVFDSTVYLGATEEVCIPIL